MRNNCFFYWLGVWALLLLLLPSCKTKRGIENVEQRDVTFNIPFETLSSKVNFSFLVNNSSSYSVGGQMKIKVDSLIIFSMQPLPGFEVARALFTTSEMYVVDRIHKRYFSMMYSEMKEKFSTEINYHSLQSLLLNVPFAFEKDGRAARMDFSVTRVVDNSFFLQRVWQDSSQEFILSSDSLLQSGSLIGKVGEIRWNYSDFSNLLKGKRFPCRIEVDTRQVNATTNQRRDFKFSLSYKKIEIDSAISFSYKIPSDYQRISLEELVEIYFKNEF